VYIPGSLQIKHSLESDEGKYECVAENNLGVSYSYGANLYVRGQHYIYFVLLFNSSVTNSTLCALCFLSQRNAAHGYFSIFTKSQVQRVVDLIDIKTPKNKPHGNNHCARYTSWCIPDNSVAEFDRNLLEGLGAGSVHTLMPTA